MWDFWKKFSQGRHGLRNISLVATLVFVVSFVYANVISSPVYAVSATRNNSTIEYQGHTFKPITSSNAETSARNLPDGTHIYEYEPTSTTREIIAFPSSANPLTATSATHLTFNFTPPDTYTRTGNITDITVDGTGTSSASEDPTAGDGTTGSSCNVAFGIGWFVCPISNFIAASADKLYEQLSQFLVVQPLRSSTDTPMYRLWVIMRDIANIAFIIVALIVIYSQITGAGISTYGLKKAFPRLIIGIVIVNMSYWICALAVDISNFLGFQLQSIFNNVSTTIGDKDFEALNQVTWANLTTGILTGSAAVAGAAIGINAIGAATLSGAITFLIPALVSVLLAILVALIVLAARQAIVTVLIILSPLALLMYVLPSTEKYFEKWKDLFMTMMFMFPIFSVLFGGSHLAGVAILASGRDANNINIIILGLAVQAVPFILTPLIVKFSGSLLGKFAGMINNPKKGLIDRTKNWSKERADLQKANILAGHGRNSAINNWSRSKANRKRSLKNKLDSYNKRFEAEADKTADAKELDTYNRETDLKQQETKAARDDEWNKLVLRNQDLLEQTMHLKIATDKVKASELEIDTIYGELKFNGDKPVSGLSRDLSQQAFITSERLSLLAIRKSMADREVNAKIDKELMSDGAIPNADGTIDRDQEGNAINRRMLDGKSLQDYATGIGHKDLMLASQTARVRKELGEHVAAADQLMRHFKLSSVQWQELAASNDGIITVEDSSGNKHSFRADDEYVKEAAIEHQFKAGSAGQKRAILRETGKEVEYIENGEIKVRKGYNYEMRAAAQAAAVESKIGNLIPFVNDVTFDTILRGEYGGEVAEKAHSLREIVEGRLKAESFAGANDAALNIMYSIADMPPEDFTLVKERYLSSLSGDARTQAEANFDKNFTKNYQAFQHDAYNILHTPELRKSTNEASRTVLSRYAVKPPGPDNQ